MISERKTGMERSVDEIETALKNLRHSIEAEQEQAAGVMREVAWVLWGDEELFRLPAHELYAKFENEVYKKGISGLLKEK